MTELSSVLHTLVDRPLAAPAPVEALVARSRRVRARRRWIQASSATVAVGLLAGVGVLVVGGDSPATTVTLSGGGTQSAGYVATAPGGYQGGGTWRLTIVRHGQTIELTSHASARCGPIGTIQPGDEVRGEIRGEESLLRAGEAAHC